MNNNINNDKPKRSNILVTILIIIILALGALCVYFAMKEDKNSNQKNDDQSNKQNNNQVNDAFETYANNLMKERKKENGVLSYQDVFSMEDFANYPIYSVRVQQDGTVNVNFHVASTSEEDEAIIIGKALEKKYKDGYKLPISDVINAYFVFNDNIEGEPQGFVFLKKDGTMYTINNKQMNSNHTISFTKLNYEKVINVYSSVNDGGTLQTIGVDINGHVQQMIIPISE